MDTELLRTFLEVHRTGHFGRAADTLCVTQSAVSARVRLLEETLGVPLFSRERNNIHLTVAGRRLLRHAESLVTGWNLARLELAVEQGEGEPLSVAGAPSLWDTHLQVWLGELAVRMPELVIRAEALAPEQILRRMQEASLDLAFTFDPLQGERMALQELPAIALELYSTRPDQEPLMAMGQGYVSVDWGIAFAVALARHFPDIPTPRLHLSLGRLARDFILERGGSAYLARPMVEEPLRRGVLHRVVGAPLIERRAYAVYRQGDERQAVVERVLGVL